jgi:hypothetical protein
LKAHLSACRSTCLGSFSRCSPCSGDVIVAPSRVVYLFVAMPAYVTHPNRPALPVASVIGRLACALVGLVLAACGGGPAATSANATVSAPRTAAPSAVPTPVASPASALSCSTATAGVRRLALVRVVPSTLDVVDTSNPVGPVRICTLSPAGGGRFISANRVAVWTSSQLELANLAQGTVTATALLPNTPSDGAFSPDGSVFAYHVGSDTNGISTHLFRAGHDTTLLTRSGIGGHGGTPYGPAYQLTFSADGKYLLAVDSLFADFPSGPSNFLVYSAADGSIAFQSSSAAFGAWSAIGSKLYFLNANPPHGYAGDLHSWDPAGGDVTLNRGLKSYFWPALSPSGTTLIYDAYGPPTPDGCAGPPQLWRIDLGSGAISQISRASSTQPVFIAANVVWSDEEQPIACGMSGSSGPDGKVLSHDLTNGSDAPVDVAQAGPDVLTSNLVDAWTS